MSTVLHPVGPQPARVYWARRLVAMMTLVVVVTVLGAMVSVARGAVSARGDDAADLATAEGADGTGAPEGDASATGGATDGADGDDGDDGAATEGGEDRGEASAKEADDAAATDDADQTLAEEDDTAAPVACGPTDLTLTLVADATAYAEEEEPVLTLTITNTGSTACTVDAGPAEHEILVTSGEDRIWSSQDCGGEGRERMLLLQPGGQDVTEVTWPWVRSDEACSEGLPAPRAGTYSAVASLIGTTSGSAVFTLG